MLNNFNTLKTKVNNLEKKINVWLIHLHKSNKNSRYEWFNDITVLNTKIGEVVNKIPDITSLVKKTNDDAKVKDIEETYSITADYNKFT